MLTLDLRRLYERRQTDLFVREHEQTGRLCYQSISAVCSRPGTGRRERPGTSRRLAEKLIHRRARLAQLRYPVLLRTGAR